jgi:hypothetical protein
MSENGIEKKGRTKTDTGKWKENVKLNGGGGVQAMRMREESRW